MSEPESGAPSTGTTPAEPAAIATAPETPAAPTPATTPPAPASTPAPAKDESKDETDGVVSRVIDRLARDGHVDRRKPNSTAPTSVAPTEPAAETKPAPPAETKPKSGHWAERPLFGKRRKGVA